MSRLRLEIDPLRPVLPGDATADRGTTAWPSAILVMAGLFQSDFFHVEHGEDERLHFEDQSRDHAAQRILNRRRNLELEATLSRALACVD
jgi:hypothetical protein